MEELRAIYQSERSEAEKLALAFDCITRRQQQHAWGEVELLRAAGDREGLVRAQIQLESVRHFRRIFASCYQGATGRRAWDGEGAV